MKTRLTALLFAFSIAAAHAENAVIPVAPAELLGVLPATPGEWRLTRSESETSLDEWLRTRATRVFRPVEPAKIQGEANASVEVTVIDTGGASHALADFVDFKPAKLGGLERLFIGSFPAQIMRGSKGHTVTQLLANQRFLIEIGLIGLPAQKPEDWLRLLRFDRLKLAPNPSRALPAQVRLDYIDELQPARNRSYVVAQSDRTPGRSPLPGVAGSMP